MRALIQRVSKASVAINNEIKGSIHSGLLVLLGIENSDTPEDAEWLARKISAMRIFEDEHKKMNLSIKDVNGNILLISQFTLHALTKKGNRPSFIKAAKPEKAIPLYRHMKKTLEHLLHKSIETGEFGAHMKVYLENDGPVTIWMDTKNKE
jgi:D-tyrosyl-tRNA(Tyr) deacylase